MGLFRKRQSKEYVEEWNFTCKCMEELMTLKNSSNPDDLIGLQMTNPEDYFVWRKQNPTLEPRDFFYRPGAPDIKAMRKSYEDLALKLHEAAVLSERIKKWDS